MDIFVIGSNVSKISLMIVVIVDESSDSLDSFGNSPSDLDQGTPASIVLLNLAFKIEA